MKKNKLTLEKFKIAKLNNPISIIGGWGNDDGTIIGKPDGGKDGEICVEMSDKWVRRPKIELLAP